MNESQKVDHWVRYWAQRQPDKPALIYEDRVILDWEFHPVLGGDEIASAVHDVKVAWLGKPGGEQGRDYHDELEALSGAGFIPDAGNFARDPEDAQILMYTSGTTGNGLPRRTSWSVRALLADLYYMLKCSCRTQTVCPLALA